MNKNFKRSNIQFSKILVVITTALFIATLITSFAIMIYLIINNVDQVVDYVVCTTALTIVGGIYSMIVKNYLSKSSLENVGKIRNGVYKEIMHTRLDYERGVLELRKEYGVDQEVIDEIDEDAPFEELSNNVISQATNKLDSVDSILEEEPESVV